MSDYNQSITNNILASDYQETDEGVFKEPPTAIFDRDSEVFDMIG